MLIRCAFYILIDVCIVLFTDVITWCNNLYALEKPITLLYEPNSLFSDGIESQAVRWNCYKGTVISYTIDVQGIQPHLQVQATLAAWVGLTDRYLRPIPC